MVKYGVKGGRGEGKTLHERKERKDNKKGRVDIYEVVRGTQGRMV